MENSNEEKSQNKGKRDVRTPEIPDISWKNEDPIVSLDKLFKYVIKNSNNASDWYYSKRDHKRRIGVTIRYGAIFMSAFAGLYPVFISIVHNTSSSIKLDPAWSAIAVGLAALLILVDKFGGFTNAWIRYVVAGQNIDNEIKLFYIKWQTCLQKMESSSNPLDQIQPMIEECRLFLTTIQTIISTETNQWVAEFQSALKNIEDSVKAASEFAKNTVQEFGAINLTVENGDKYQSGWAVLIDGVKNKECNGTSAVITGLKPGIISIKVLGTLQGRDFSVEKAVIITQGSINNLTLQLPL